jgi:hypothetical protein
VQRGRARGRVRLPLHDRRGSCVPRAGGRPRPRSLGPKSEEGPVGSLGLAYIGATAQSVGGLDCPLPAPLHARLICSAPWLRKHPLMHRLLQRLPAPANKTQPLHTTSYTHHTPHIALPILSRRAPNLSALPGHSSGPAYLMSPQQITTTHLTATLECDSFLI